LNNNNCNVSDCNYAFIVLTEIWLTLNFLDCELSLINYNVYRYDRCLLTSDCLRGGGVLIGIRKDIASCSIITSVFNDEQIFVSFSLGTSSYVVGCVYIPPLSPSIVYESHLNSVEFLIN